jgi:zinc/manganese transport system substrate-binding protein
LILTIIINNGYSVAMTKLAALSLVVASSMVLAGCAADESTSDDGASSAPEVSSEVRGPSVVTTTTMLGSVARDILVCALGNDSSLTVLMPIGADPHDFQASSEQVALMTSADLVVTNGLSLEEGISAVLESLSADGVPILELADELDPLPFAEKSTDDGHGHNDDHSADESSEDDHGHGDFDPHFWLDMERMAKASEIIGQELSSATGDGVYLECGDSVASDIRHSEADIIATLAVVPEENRVLVTDHDAFSYFADAYDFRVVGVVVPGGSTLADPSSRELADLVDTIRAQEVTAIFANTAVSSAVSDAIAAEAGGDVRVYPLYVGSLGGPGTGAETYREMMQANADIIAQVLTD